MNWISIGELVIPPVSASLKRIKNVKVKIDVKNTSLTPQVNYKLLRAFIHFLFYEHSFDHEIFSILNDLEIDFENSGELGLAFTIIKIEKVSTYTYEVEFTVDIYYKSAKIEMKRYIFILREQVFHLIPSVLKDDFREFYKLVTNQNR